MEGDLEGDLDFFKKAHPAVKHQLADVTTLPTFLETTGELTLTDCKLIVEQALVLLEQTYVHLPFKQAMHAVDPIQRLKLLQSRLEQMSDEGLLSEIQFHNEMIEIFTSLRDLHTTYSPSLPYSLKVAFLPFYVEEYFEDGEQKYLVSKWMEGFSHPTFKLGVEVLYWNGVPIRRAVELNAAKHAGSNMEARRARGVEGMTIRPMKYTLPPDAKWVVIGYQTPEGEELEFRQKWLVFSPEPEPSGVDPDSATAEATALGIDLLTDKVRQIKKVLYAPKVFELEKRLAEEGRMRATSSQGLDSIFPNVFTAKKVETQYGTFGYIRIWTFSVKDEDAFVSEFVRLVELLPVEGLIIDVRGNGGGLIPAAEQLLQVLTPKPIESEHWQFTNTPLTHEICSLHAPSPLYPGFDLGPWVKSIAQSVATGAIYSRSFPITPVEKCNAVGQRYYGPVVLITDALCYSSTDIFAAGFQDHQIGPILGASNNTGAGGANVWAHGLFQDLMSEPIEPYKPLPNSPFKPLPKGASMSVSVRRSLRVHDQAGTPVEDLGITPDFRHYMTEKDHFEGNIDLITKASEILASLPVYTLSAEVKSSTEETLTVETTTKNITRVDCYFDGRPRSSHDVSDGTTQLDVELPLEGAKVLELKCYNEKDELVAACRVNI